MSQSLSPEHEGVITMEDALTRATYKLADTDLQWMVLSKERLPQNFTHFEVVREGDLSNEAMADLPLSGHTADELRSLGRVTGYQREWVTTVDEPLLKDDADLAVATVVHLMDSPQAVSTWMTKVFLEEFKAKVGENLGTEHQLVSVEQVELEGKFHDEAVGVRAIQKGPKGFVSSSVLDFRLGRLLGVVYVVTFGDQNRLEIAETLGKKLERHMVAVAVGAA
jgi:hypothetical protein